MISQDVLTLLTQIPDTVAGKSIKVSRYPEMAEGIPDDILEIHEVFPEDELEVIAERFQPYLGEYGVVPFLCTLGDNVAAIGVEPTNWGRIYYYDSDFGIFELDSSLEEFLAGLQIAV